MKIAQISFIKPYFTGNQRQGLLAFASEKKMEGISAFVQSHFSVVLDLAIKFSSNSFFCEP